MERWEVIWIVFFVVVLTAAAAGAAHKPSPRAAFVAKCELWCPSEFHATHAACTLACAKLAQESIPQ